LRHAERDDYNAAAKNARRKTRNREIVIRRGKAAAKTGESRRAWMSLLIPWLSIETAIYMTAGEPFC
ncbi:MAG: hypothetical protein WBF93_21370, partial [Pirellulales bacterium]